MRANRRLLSPDPSPLPERFTCALCGIVRSSVEKEGGTCIRCMVEVWNSEILGETRLPKEGVTNV